MIIIALVIGTMGASLVIFLHQVYLWWASRVQEVEFVEAPDYDDLPEKEYYETGEEGLDI